MKQIMYKDEMFYWNEEDTKLLLVNDWIEDLGIALNYCDSFNVAIQAGGACGTWPIKLSKYFKEVYTFEPHPENFLCLKRNIEARLIQNITYRQAGLSDVNGFCDIKVHESEINNSGAYYTMPNLKFGIEQLTLDNYKDLKISFIQLDVEGREYQVLKGAEQILINQSPIIMIEEKALPHDKETGHIVGKSQKYLESLGYKLVTSIHRDLVFKK